MKNVEKKRIEILCMAMIRLDVVYSYMAAMISLERIRYSQDFDCRHSLTERLLDCRSF